MAVYVTADNIYSPIAGTTEDNFRQLLAGVSGIRHHQKRDIHPDPFYASLFETLETTEDFTRFEQLLLNSITEALSNSDTDITHPSTCIIISSTKGNISLLENAAGNADQLPLHVSAKKIAGYFNNPNEPIVVSNACISGLSALITGKRLIEAGVYKNVVVAGADTISSFVFSGFNAFQAISPLPCRPYDANRNGVTLGEAAATMILSGEKNGHGIRITGGSGSNDANHISGPSRTGEELNMAIRKAIQESGFEPGDIDFISAHGTATLYNDEMEAKAITLAGLQDVPVNSLKGYYGHTLGAAGIIESVIAVQSMKKDTVLPTKGFEQLGVSLPINVSGTTRHLKINNCLKTASGFGGCNAAVIFSQ